MFQLFLASKDYQQLDETPETEKIWMRHGDNV